MAQSQINYKIVKRSCLLYFVFIFILFVFLDYHNTTSNLNTKKQMIYKKNKFQSTEKQFHLYSVLTRTSIRQLQKHLTRCSRFAYTFFIFPSIYLDRNEKISSRYYVSVDEREMNRPSYLMFVSINDTE